MTIDSPKHPRQPASRQPVPVEPSADALLKYVMIAVAVWGGLLSIGALLFGIDMEAGKPVFSPNPVRGLIVLAAVGAFLGMWLLAWRRRRRSLGHRK